MNRGKKIIELIPYKNFKEKIKITKENQDKQIEIYEDYIIIF